MYLRKSSDNEDRQVQSIPDQKKELEPLVTNKNLKIVKVFGESKTAKKPGRPYFNEMLKMIEEGKADGIICWKINRLARNPKDGGDIQWLLQQGVIKSIITPGREFLPTDNVLMMAVELGVANQFILDLSKDVRRGMKTKVEKGYRPAKAPLGYINDKYGEKGSKQIFVDSERFPLVRRMWDELLTGWYSVPQILNKANDEWGLRTQKGFKLNPSTIYRMFTNPFYYGEYNYEGEVRIGKHQPMITKEEFDRAQAILGKAGKPRPRLKRLPFTGIIRCGECDCMITSEEKFKVIKSKGETRTYIYHHCTKKKRDIVCEQKALKYEELARQVMEQLDAITIPEQFLHWALEILQRNNAVEEENRSAMLHNQRKQFDECLKRIDNLINLYISSDNVSRELLSEQEFKTQKNALMQEKVRLEGEIRRIEQGVNEWVEVTEKTFYFATYAKKEFDKGDYERKSEMLQALGQNFVLRDEKLTISMLPHLLTLKNGLEKEPLKSARLEPQLSGSITRENSPLGAAYSHWSG
jgi:site-specific DNA recombinase